METTMTLITSLLKLFSQVNLVMDRRNLWTLAAMVALLLKGKRAHLSELGNALPGSGKANSRVHKVRRWLSNPHISPAQFLPVFLRMLAPFLSDSPGITLIIDRTEWQRRKASLNVFVCSVVYHSRSFPLYWTLLPTRGCSSLTDQQALLTPVLTAIAAHPRLPALPKQVLADREFCAPQFAAWLASQGIRFCLRVKKSYRITRSDIPSTPIRLFFAHCQQGTAYFFDQVTFTASSPIQAHLFLYWREDCTEPLALMTDLTDAAVLPHLYRERMFIETLNRDLKSGGYDVERGKLTDPKRLANLLLPMAFAYLLTVIQGHLDDLQHPTPPLKKRRLSLFTQARKTFHDLFDRHPFERVKTFFQQFLTFLVSVIAHPSVTNWTTRLLKFSHQQHLLLQ
jgi:hypothetical protein